MAIEENTDKLIEVPAPTAWPMIMALGLTLSFAGLVTNAAVSMVGMILFIAGAVGWFGEVLPIEHRESVQIEPGVEAIVPAEIGVDYLHVGELAAGAVLRRQDDGRRMITNYVNDEIDHRTGHHGSVGKMEPEYIIGEIGVVRCNGEPAVSVLCDDVINDCTGFSHHQAVISDYRRGTERMQRAVLGRGELRHGIALVTNQLVGKSEFFA